MTNAAVQALVGDLEEIKVERRGAVLVVTLDRAEANNTLVPRVYDELHAVYTNLDPDVRAVVFTSTGEKAFCTGADMKAAAKNLRTLSRHVSGAMKFTPVHYDVWLPYLVAVNGTCSAAGFHFLADADYVVTADHATFLETHVNVGQVGAIEPMTLAPRIGIGNALRLTVLGKAGRLSAADALRISLVDEVVPKGQELERAVHLATEAAKGSPAAIEISKKAIYSTMELPMQEALEQAWQQLLQHREHHPDATEGPKAFAEKREPRWQAPRPAGNDGGQGAGKEGS